ncbi:MAG: hypothetical protein ACTSQV_02700 [Alphaproteobacteria bacterium]
MKNFCLAVVALCIAQGNGAVAQDTHGMKRHDSPAHSHSCEVAVTVEAGAEHQPGGAHYAGPALKHHGKHVMAMPEMKGAHMLHKAQHGGSFFMAPNKVNHVEAVYSEKCGFRLYLYNAFTRQIHVGRFRAFIKVVPKDEDQGESIRFLFPNLERTALEAKLDTAIAPPFEIEIYVKFPESQEPELFNIRVPGR